MLSIFKDKKTIVLATALILLGCTGVYKMRGKAAQVLPVSFVDLVLSPDGKNFLATNADSDQDLLLVSVDEQHIRPISHTEGVQNPMWGPDSKTIYFMSYSPDISIAPQNRSATPQIIQRKNAFSDDSPEELVSINDIDGSINHPMPSPDGENLAYLETTMTANKDFMEHCRIFNLKTRQSVAVEGYQPVPYTLNPVQWSADGKTLYFRGMAGNDAFSLGQMRKRLNSSKNGIVAYNVQNGVTYFLAAEGGGWEVSHSGQKVALATGRDVHGESNVLRVVDMTGKELNLTKDPSIFPDMFWNQDDSALYYITGGAAGVVKIHRWNMADNSVSIVSTETERRGRLLGIANGRLYYSIVQGKDDSKVKSIPIS